MRRAHTRRVKLARGRIEALSHAEASLVSALRSPLGVGAIAVPAPPVHAMGDRNGALREAMDPEPGRLFFHARTLARADEGRRAPRSPDRYRQQTSSP